MLIHHYLTVALVWVLYGSYCYVQYSDTLKTSNWFIAIALTYSLTANILWVTLAKTMDKQSTLNYALLWDGGVHIVAFLVPILLFGDKLKIHTAIGMGFIFTGIFIVLFYDKVKELF